MLLGPINEEGQGLKTFEHSFFYLDYPHFKKTEAIAGKTVFRIRDLLVRIRIRGSVPLRL
jgi:hypothetical protein